MNVFLVSLGCPKNFVDTEVMAGTLLKSGCGITFDQREADITLINTCAFLPSAREESYQAIRDAVRWKKRKSGRRVAVAGCLIEWDKKDEAKALFPEVDSWSGIDGVAQIAETLDRGANFPGAPSPRYLYNENTPRILLTMPHVAYLKIADGCNNRCAYCSIPNIRGTLRSRSLASCVQEAKNLLAGGVREIVVIAQDVTCYGADNRSGDSLEKLLAELDKLSGDFWIRLLYTHPAHYTDGLIETIKNSRHVLHYLDIPLQHISDRILKSMGRIAGKAQTLELLAKLRAAMPDLAVRTTFITGLPGETEAEFAELCQFINDFKFHRLGVFEYAPEPNTAAAGMPNQVPAEIAAKRADDLMTMQRTISKKLNQALVGREMTVLIDEANGKNGVGRGTADAPEIDNAIYVKSSKRLREGEFVRVRITGGDEYDLQAEVINQ
ncbi:MAG: 30S ribosomal protein S12 methylthiotransferase RimO [Victivallaceae bacterium]|nr:30S ribosomal protein S12 methylthiotransferase RimO [Victivallaceae bacterium]